MAQSIKRCTGFKKKVHWNYRTPSQGMCTYSKLFKRWMSKHKYKKVVIKQGGVKVKDLDYPNQRVIAYCNYKGRRHHYTAVVNNEIHDTWDCKDYNVDYVWVQR